MNTCSLDDEWLDEYEDTNCSDTVSIYLDDNVPLDEYPDYPLCSASWIGDGVCEDSCMSHACSYDGGDCDFCGARCLQVYAAWNTLAGTAVYEVNHTEACGSFWAEAVELVNIESTLNCSDLVGSADLNDDKWLNFREFQFVAGTFVDDEGISSETWLNLNCSICIGMEYYNPTHQ